VLRLERDRAGRFTGACVRGGEIHAAGAAVLAVPHREAAALLGGAGEAFDTAAARSLGASPIVAVHLWFDRAVSDYAMAGLIDSPVHWVFDRARIGGARDPGYLALVTSAAKELEERSREELRRMAVDELKRFFPAAGRARLRRARVLKERRATPAFRLDNLASRPEPRTSAPNLLLAGDWTATGLPATLEGAAASGHRAAALLSS
jgi:uncharacterized protein with NAD-binding domain and iron-sulfur cluster